MATILFYEKPGCINNTKQKVLLRSAGHQVETRNLLTEPWTQERLRCFFGGRPITECFNATAPAIKSGQVHPDQLNMEAALDLMLQDPLLIRRPLMQVGDHCEVGFDMSTVDRWIGLKTAIPDQKRAHKYLIQQDLQTCPSSSPVV